MEIQLLEQKNEIERNILSLKQGEYAEKNRYDNKVRSLVMNTFAVIFEKANLEDEKKDKYCEELSDKKFSMMELIERAENILKQENL